MVRLRPLAPAGAVFHYTRPSWAMGFSVASVGPIEARCRILLHAEPLHCLLCCYRNLFPFSVPPELVGSVPAGALALRANPGSLTVKRVLRHPQMPTPTLVSRHLNYSGFDLGLNYHAILLLSLGPTVACRQSQYILLVLTGQPRYCILLVENISSNEADMLDLKAPPTALIRHYHQAPLMTATMDGSRGAWR